ncbi:MAG: SH3 domain-containing protein [Anaerolineae bacterium]|nr:SH3 domain-containing protein [Anaerolineae bacterium]
MRAKIGRVIADHTSAYPDPLTLVEGEVVTVGQHDTQWPGFVWCTNADGKGGWVPDRYLTRQGEAGVINCAYTAAELTVVVDDEVTILKEESDWAWCLHLNGDAGWVPLDNLKCD